MKDTEFANIHKTGFAPCLVKTYLGLLVTKGNRQVAARWQAWVRSAFSDSQCLGKAALGFNWKFVM
jgi:hypothetical protein